MGASRLRARFLQFRSRRHLELGRTQAGLVILDGNRRSGGRHGVSPSHRRQTHYLGPLRMYFSDDGLHLQDPASQGRTRWDQFLGYLEDSKMFLLYHNPKLYRIIPKRVLGNRGQEFRSVVETKLPRFKYRKPFPAGKVVSPSEPRPAAQYLQARRRSHRRGLALCRKRDAHTKPVT